ncbi:FAD-dependent oxidoreductase [Mesorhizobium sp. WSM3876]|uniref:NAD(P)/FAD-dependent oxidoreductase n=1 Tax=Mesorhizobium sp. WSM3876 TaxID=422277 RepID=UPI000BB02A23|nr:FAD-dependent oxidoreductase [Mesorhizobium sp. WSM3876]PBB86867.1 FAD-dependent oxidoreductase [Mesorhizobium sp. WSM3876]
MRIVVIGGGIVGASIAYHLACKRAEVIVVERGDAGRATSAGAGIICPWLDRENSQAFYELAYRSAAYYDDLIPALAEEGETELGFRRTGAMLLAIDSDALAGPEALVRARAEAAPQVGQISRLDPAQAQDLFPALDKQFSALHIAGGARLNGRLLAGALERVSVRRGAIWRRGDANLVVERGRATGVTVDGETLAADAVVVAAGSWAPELLERFGITLPVKPQRGQIVHLRLPGVDTTSWPVLHPADADSYLVTFDDSRVVVGATRETGSGFDYRVTAGGIHDVIREALRVAPGLAAATLVETRVGFRPVSATSNPLLGPAPGIAGLFIGNGMGANGLTLAPYSASLLASQVLGEPASPLLAAFHL